MSGLLDRVAQRVGAPAGLILRRSHAGRVQRQQGAWSWWAEDARGHEVLAGYVSLTELARSPSLVARPNRNNGIRAVLEIDAGPPSLPRTGRKAPERLPQHPTGDRAGRAS